MFLLLPVVRGQPAGAGRLGGGAALFTFTLLLQAEPEPAAAWTHYSLWWVPGRGTWSTASGAVSQRENEVPYSQRPLSSTPCLRPTRIWLCWPDLQLCYRFLWTGGRASSLKRSQWPVLIPLESLLSNTSHMPATGCSLLQVLHMPDPLICSFLPLHHHYA